MYKFNSFKKVVFMGTLALVASLPTQAEIIEQSGNSFTVKHSFVSNTDISNAAHEFGHVGRWWLSEFSSSGDGQNMFFNGEGLHENMPNGKTITHLSTVEKGLWKGSLGQLINEKIVGQLKVSIKEHHYGIKITMEYAVKSDSIVQNQHWPNDIDSMIGAQMTSLKGALKKRKSQVRRVVR